VNVLLVTVHFAPAWIEGGVTRSMWNSARSLVMAGAQVQVVTTNAYLDETNQVPQVRDEAGVTIRTVPVLARLGGAAHRAALAPGLVPAVWNAGRDADLCLVQGLWTVPVAIASTICRVQRVPYMLWAKGGLEQISLSEKARKKEIYLSLFLAGVIRRSAGVVFASESEYLNSEQALGRTPGILHTHGFDPIPRRRRRTEDLRREFGLPADCLLLGMSGRIHPRKGFDVILSALADCPDSVHLVSFGPDLEGHLREVRRRAETLGVSDRFHVLGYLEEEKLQSTYASIDLLVVPSYGESFGNVVIEALGQGTEVMVGNRVALAGYVREKRLGRVVVGHEPRRWAAAIRGWIARAGEFDRDRACRAVAAGFDLEASGRELLGDFERLLSGRD
jgi:glycosyltransferase involved in cell wall biosynthesis